MDPRNPGGADGLIQGGRGQSIPKWIKAEHRGAVLQYSPGTCSLVCVVSCWRNKSLFAPYSDWEASIEVSITYFLTYYPETVDKFPAYCFPLSSFLRYSKLSFSPLFHLFLLSNFLLLIFFPFSHSFHLTLTANTGSLHFSSLDAKCLLYQSHFLIHSYTPPQQHTVPSVTAQHPHSPPLTLSLWWLIPSVTRLSHTLTKPSHFHQSVNPFKRERAASCSLCDCEVWGHEQEGMKKKGDLGQNRHK